MYRFFRQARYSQEDHKVNGYELLLREQIAGNWRVPAEFNTIESALWVELAVAAIQNLAVDAKVAINLDHDQFVDERLLQAMVEIQRQIGKKQLLVEITERANGLLIAGNDIVCAANFLTMNGVRVSLDDVGSGQNQFELVRILLPYATEMKFALQNFAGKRPLARHELYFWRQLADKADKHFVLEGIETPADVTLANRLAIDLRQGYFYSRPQPA
ncbi:EAL domain-containing protein [Loigolactobacillus zhaoyuanensis]|uniref:EAL domain-containing protein n=1 Tax=Loigolactobacillus zhaoyuanensis TaxID=2486017 RepID=A0ABW8UH34_9LACO|nr:EAL domain-containing protein [Loigolactobacillus zhaoyuanensis]